MQYAQNTSSVAVYCYPIRDLAKQPENNVMEDHHDHHEEYHEEPETSTIEYIKFVAVLSFITLVAWVLLLFSDENTVVEFLRLFMGVFLVIFSVFKFIGYQMFSMMFAGYDPIARRIKPYASVYPFIEMFLGSLYLFNLFPVFRNITVIILMGIGSFGVFQEVFQRKSGIQCACLGNIIKLPLSTVTLLEDVGMVTMAVAMLALQ
jgi:hypothetical protein